MAFIRVRGARPGDALHEFDIPEVTYRRRPDRYKVIDKKPVAKQRTASFISGVVKAPRPKRAPRKSAPSAGLTPKEDNNGS